jgi:hypothetical protein
LSMALLVPSPNNWLQARPGFAWLFVLAPRPGLPEPKRWATDSAQVPLLTLPERVDKDSTCQASCALGILRQGARSRTGATRTSHHKRVPKLRRLCRCVNSEDTCTLHLHEPKVRRRGRRCGWVVLGCVGFGILMGGRGECQWVWVRSLVAGGAAAVLALSILQSRKAGACARFAILLHRHEILAVATR